MTRLLLPIMLCTIIQCKEQHKNKDEKANLIHEAKTKKNINEKNEKENNLLKELQGSLHDFLQVGVFLSNIEETTHFKVVTPSELLYTLSKIFFSTHEDQNFFLQLMYQIDPIDIYSVITKCNLEEIDILSKEDIAFIKKIDPNLSKYIIDTISEDTFTTIYTARLAAECFLYAIKDLLPHQGHGILHEKTYLFSYFGESNTKISDLAEPICEYLILCAEEWISFLKSESLYNDILEFIQKYTSTRGYFGITYKFLYDLDSLNSKIIKSLNLKKSTSKTNIMDYRSAISRFF